MFSSCQKNVFKCCQIVIVSIDTFVMPPCISLYCSKHCQQTGGKWRSQNASHSSWLYLFIYFYNMWFFVILCCLFPDGAGASNGVSSSTALHHSKDPTEPGPSKVWLLELSSLGNFTLRNMGIKMSSFDLFWFSFLGKMQKYLQLMIAPATIKLNLYNTDLSLKSFLFLEMYKDRIVSCCPKLVLASNDIRLCPWGVLPRLWDDWRNYPLGLHF